MSFLQPFMVWGLLAASLPIVIHLLNRLRYRTVKWGAMMFLVKAAKSSTRHARLRHYLILAARTLMLLCFAIALCRPIVGGWLGMTLSGPPDTVIVVLDRSASMEAVDPRRQSSKREYALSLFGEVAAETVASSRFVLIENVLKTPREVGGPSALAGLDITGPTDTAADLPAMLREAVTYILENRPGRTEIWIASDLQRSNWRPESDEWRRLSAEAAALSQDVRVRLLALNEDYGRNTTLSLRQVLRRTRGGVPSLDLGIELRRDAGAEKRFPVVVTLDGTRSQRDMEMAAPSMFTHHSLGLKGQEGAGGWGVLELPADENERDNAGYFVYGGDAELYTAVVADGSASSRYLRLAAAPAPALLKQSSEAMPTVDAAKMDWPRVACVIWQAGRAPANGAAWVELFVRAGGSLLVLPPADDGDAGVLGVQWGEVESVDEKTPFRIGMWNEYDGPLARTAQGQDLPVAAVSCMRRRIPVFDNSSETGGVDNAAGDWHAVASFVDGKPFLLRSFIGKGQAYVCTTLPEAGWSSLGKSWLLIPMVQRIVAAGGGRLSGQESALCGEWTPTGDEPWMTVDSETRKDCRWQAGVYRSGERLVALNRPSREDMPGALSIDEACDLFGELPVQVAAKLERAGTSQLQSEIWRQFIYLALLCMVGESILLLGERVKPKRHE